MTRQRNVWRCWRVIGNVYRVMVRQRHVRIKKSLISSKEPFWNETEGKKKRNTKRILFFFLGIFFSLPLRTPDVYRKESKRIKKTFTNDNTAKNSCYDGEIFRSGKENRTRMKFRLDVCACASTYVSKIKPQLENQRKAEFSTESVKSALWMLIWYKNKITLCCV